MQEVNQMDSTAACAQPKFRPPNLSLLNLLNAQKKTSWSSLLTLPRLSFRSLSTCKINQSASWSIKSKSLRNASSRMTSTCGSTSPRCALRSSMTFSTLISTSLRILAERKVESLPCTNNKLTSPS